VYAKAKKHNTEGKERRKEKYKNPREFKHGSFGKRKKGRIGKSLVGKTEGTKTERLNASQKKGLKERNQNFM